MTGSLNSSCVTGHTRSGGLSSNASKAVFAADASDKVGGESGRRVPEGEEHKPLLRVADILVVVFGLPIIDRQIALSTIGGSDATPWQYRHLLTC